MKIKLDKPKKITLLRWLQRGEIDTDEMKELTTLFQIEVIRNREQVKDIADNENTTYENRQN